jgi:hypothetical protein
MKLSRFNKDAIETAIYSLPIGFTIGLLYKRLTSVNLLITLGVGLLAMGIGCNLLVSNVIMSLALILLTVYNVREGFLSNDHKAITNKIRKLKSSGTGMFGSVVEGFEDEKSTKKTGKPAPSENAENVESKPQDNEEQKENTDSDINKKILDIQKSQMASPFKLGEIPKQTKGGPHIDASSTLIKAIQGLNPDQISAMTKDTQQLMDTQKSLMGMLSSMKPMMKDGKELMETFEQMFGK